MKILILIILSLAVISTDPYIFNLDNNKDLKLSHLFTDLKTHQFIVKEQRNSYKTANFTSHTNVQLDLQDEGSNGFYIPKLVVNNAADDSTIDYSLTIKPSTTSVTFDYISPKNITSNVHCELNNNEVAFSYITDSQIGDYEAKKSIQDKSGYNIILSKQGKVYVHLNPLKGDDFYHEISTIIKNTDLANDEFKNIFPYTLNDESMLVLLGEKFIFFLYIEDKFDFHIEINIIAQIDKSLNRYLLDIDNDLIESISADVKKGTVYMFVKSGDYKGIHTLVENANDTSIFDHTFNNIVEVGKESLELNIVNVVTTYAPENAVAYILVENKGILIYDLVDKKPLRFFDNPYISKMDSVYSFEYIFLGLYFADNVSFVDEFFVEIAIHYSNPSELALSRAYLSKQEFVVTMTDTKRSFTYFATKESVYLIPRNQPTQKMIPIYSLSLADLSEFYVLTSSHHLSVIKMKGKTKDDLVAFSFTQKHPTYQCTFDNNGQYIAKVSSYLRSDVADFSEHIYTINIGDYVQPSGSGSSSLIVAIVGISVIIIVAAVVCFLQRKRRVNVELNNLNPNYDRL
jgi:hypothetical protein